MHKHNPNRFGFTIVELLVVIVVIGVLATISLVSYTAISKKATVASMQLDLASASEQLKIFQTTKSAFPVSVVDCPSPAAANACLKLSSDNYVSYYSAVNNISTQTFSLFIKNGSLTYQITQDSKPAPPPPIFNSGGAITSNGAIRSHTFTSGSSTITAVSNGDVDVTIYGAGGGGGGYAGGCGIAYDGSTGTNTTVATSGGTWLAYSGGGGTATYGDCDMLQVWGNIGPNGGTGVLGSASLTGWASVIGGGGSGGISQAGVGGKGGKLVGKLSVSNNQQIVITIGPGGAGGFGDGGNTGGNGTNGSVVISYPY